MSEGRFRLVTRADFDGVVCGALLKELGMVDEVSFVEPWQVQGGLVKLGPGDITANLPYVPAVHLCFDHHASEALRQAAGNNWVIAPDAPSTARVIYDHFGGKPRFPDISDDLMTEVDRADAAQYDIEDILSPDNWTLINFILDPRTGLHSLKEFRIPDSEFLVDMMTYLRHHPVDEIMRIPDVEERLHTYGYHTEFQELQLTRCSVTRGKVVITDRRTEAKIHPGNRFMIYGLFPDCSVSIHLQPMPNNPALIEISVGKSIIDRSSKANIGAIMLEYGGGGHKAVGTCRVPDADVARVVDEVVAKIQAAG